MRNELGRGMCCLMPGIGYKEATGTLYIDPDLVYGRESEDGFESKAAWINHTVAVALANLSDMEELPPYWNIRILLDRSKMEGRGK